MDKGFGKKNSKYIYRAFEETALRAYKAVLWQHNSHIALSVMLWKDITIQILEFEGIVFLNS